MATPAPKKGAPAPVAKKPVATPAKAVQAVQGNGADAVQGNNVVSVKLADNDKVLAVEYDFGSTIGEMEDKFGAEAVFAKAKVGMVLELQAKLRRHLTLALKGDKDGKTTPLPKDAQELIEGWAPSTGGTRSRVSAAEKVSTLVGKLSAEERAALITRLKAGE